MELKEIIDLSYLNKCLKIYFLDKVINHPEYEFIQSWLVNLLNENLINNDRIRFAICMAIDLKYELLEVDNFLSIILQIKPATFKEPHIEFENVLKNDFNQFYSVSTCTDVSYQKDKYLTILTWFKLSNKCKKVIGPKQFEVSYIMYIINKTRPMSDFTDWCGFIKKLTWVMKSSDFEDIKKKTADSTQLAEFVIDAVGLENGRLEPSNKLARFIYIVYPDEASWGIQCHQPTTLSGDFLGKDGLYLSYFKSDGYGRTVSTTGKNVETKERVFLGTNYSNEKFVVHPLGTPSVILKKNPLNAIDLGFKRLKKDNDD